MAIDNGKFRASAHMIDYLLCSKLNLRDLRFVLATIYFQAVNSDWPSSDWENLRNEPVWMGLKDYRRVGCAPKSNDTRHFHATVNFWKSEQVLFDELDLNASKGFVTWQFSEVAFELMSDMNRYALMTAQNFGIFRTQLELLLYLQIALHHRMERPSFSFRGYTSENNTGSSNMISRKEVDRRLKPTLARLADLFEYGFVVGYEQMGVRPGYTDCIIRIQHRNTLWPASRISKFPPRTEQYCMAPSSGWPAQRR